MKRVGSFIGDWWRLVVPYFKSEEWPIAISLLVGAVVLTFVMVGFDKAFNSWNGRFYDAIQNKDETAFWQEIIFFSWLAAIYIVLLVVRSVVSPYLRLRWRRWLTRRYLAHWFDDRGYYRIELERSVDNADQRIAEDLNQLGLYTMQLFLGILSSVSSLVVFTILLWELSGPLSLSAIGLDISIPGYMAWVCLIYAASGTLLAHIVGRRLIPLNFMQQRYEANFRFSLMRVRENTEGIALYRGERLEFENLNARFVDVFNNGFRVLLTQAQLSFYQFTYGQIAVVFPYVVTAPRFFAGAITLGVMTKTASAFSSVQTALSFFIDNYTSLAELRAVMDRLKGLQLATDEKLPTAISVAPQAGSSDVAIENLTLSLPTGEALLQNLSLPFKRGQSVLVRGASGTGKSTLFRALAGIWPFGSGTVRVPAGARVLFLPQKPYIPIGTLRDAVKYPDEQSAATDGDVANALQAAGLGHLIGRLDEVAHWNNLLSGGEQQRLAAARALVYKPDWLFLDEATASLDDPAQAQIYDALKSGLPNTTMVSIGHRPNLQQWHERTLELRRAPGQVGTLVEGGVA